ncbi:MAG: hypothetical protein WCY89_11550, partial [Flavobacteriaceae bacterium]
DWDLFELSDEEKLQGVRGVDSSLQNIKFIRQINSICFAPIFIFSKLGPDSIKQKLYEEGLYDDKKSNHIFIESKENIKQARALFSKVKKWLVKTPSIYAMKEWERSMIHAKNSLFWDFYNISPVWINILMQTYEYDGVDKNHELGTFLYKNLIARTNSCVFDEKIVNKKNKNITKNDLRKVLEHERFLVQDKISANPATGDVFKIQNDQNGEYQYFINIRPDCDFIREAKKGVDVVLYCLRGRVVTEQKINQKKWKGNFDEKINQTFIPFIDDGKIIEILFKDIKTKKWNDIKDKRIGRLLPPYITRIQQKYAFYLQRQGLPAIPFKAVK